MRMMKIGLRCGTAEDFDQIFKIEKENMQQMVEEFRPQGWDESACINQIRSRLEQGQVFLLENEEDVVGYYYFGSTPSKLCVSLDSIQVLNRHQGQGYGTRLLECFLENMKQRGYQRAMLNVYPSNPAIHLYKRFGFQQVKATEEHIFMQREI